MLLDLFYFETRRNNTKHNFPWQHTARRHATPNSYIEIGRAADAHPHAELTAPDIVEAIMDERQPAELGVHVLRDGFPVEWGKRSSRMFLVGAPA